jgi:hypothetical protein
VRSPPVVTSLATNRRLEPREADGTLADGYGYGYWEKAPLPGEPVNLAGRA